VEAVQKGGGPAEKTGKKRSFPRAPQNNTTQKKKVRKKRERVGKKKRLQREGKRTGKRLGDKGLIPTYMGVIGEGPEELRGQDT